MKMVKYCYCMQAKIKHAHSFYLGLYILWSVIARKVLLCSSLKDPRGRLRRCLLRNLGELPMVANEAGDDDRDDGHEGEEDEESGEAGDRKTNSVDDFLAHPALKNLITCSHVRFYSKVKAF